jgi:hypothetical protein
MKLLGSFMVGLAMLGLSSAASAEKLLGNSIICDNKEDLALLEQPHFNYLKGLGADKVFEKVKLELAAQELETQINQILLNGALKEEEVYNQYHVRGTTVGNVANLHEQQRRGDATTTNAASFLSNCAPSGKTEQIVSVIERKAIAGVLKVRASLNGAAADVWARSNAVLQN